MRPILSAVSALALVAGGVEAKTVVERPVAALAPVVVQLDGIPQGALVTMLLRDIMRVPYVIAPDVLADRRPISVRLIMPRSQIPERVVGFLRKNGMSVELVGGTVYVGRKGSSFADYAGSAVPAGSPLAPGRALQNPQAFATSSDLGVSHVAGSTAEKVAQDPAPVFAPGLPTPDMPLLSDQDELLVYDPAHRDPAYLSSVVLAVLPQLRVGSRGEVKAEPAEQLINGPAAADLLVMTGPAEQLERARRLILTLDRPRPLVAVKAVVLQVSNIQVRGSALSVLAKIGGGKFQLGSFGADVPAAQFVRLGTGALSAVLSAVREDSRFRVVASPNLSALSGSTATINSGSQVPTVGAVAVTDGGMPVQSVVYRDSGITLTVRPVVRGRVIEMEVRQERSSFVRTTTGVEDSPTLQKASASAQVLMRSGESVVLAGLTEDSDGNTREGLFGGLLGVRSRDKSSSELLVVLQAELVPAPSVAKGHFLEVEPVEEPDVDPLAPA